MKLLTTLLLAVLPLVLAKDNRRHFYTTNPGGESAPQNGYQEQGIIAYAFSSQVAGTVPLYRCFYAASTGGYHFYTQSSNCENAPNFHLEGVAWYCYPSQTGSTISLDRYYQSNGDHWYVARGQEVGQYDKPYYGFEQTACWIYSSQVNGAVPVYGWTYGSDT